MDIQILIYIIAAAIVGGIISYIFAKSKFSNKTDGTDIPDTNDDNPSNEVQDSEKARLQEQLYEAQQENDNLNSTINSLRNEKNRVEKYLNTIKDANNDLQEQIDQFSRKESKKIDSNTTSDVARLKDEIKSLNQQIDDLEEDLDETEKKLKKKKAESQEALDAKEKLAKELSNMQGELDREKKELKRATLDLNLKNSSLSFIQSVLQAPEYRTEDTQTLYEHVIEMENFIHGELYDIEKQLFNLTDYGNSLFNEGLSKWKYSTFKSWITGKKAIAFVGEFSAGKTSIVNRILSQDDPNVPRLPVSTKATTAIPTYISGGAKVDYQFYTPDNRLKKISSKIFNSVTKEILDQVPGISNLIKYFVMTYKNEYLDGLSILDTPGFNSNDEEDATRTIEVINECDALFWVIDVNAGEANQTSINLIKNNLQKPLFVVINKIDTKAPTEVRNVENHIKQTFNKADIEVQDYICFSQSAPLSDIMNPILSIGKTSEEENYLSEVDQMLGNHLDILNQSVKDANGQYKKALKIYNDNQDSFNANYNTLVGNCEFALSIINNSWTEQGFSKLWGNEDKYELSKSDGDNLKETIDDYIADNNMKCIRNDYDSTVNSAEELQSKYEEKLQTEQNYRLLKDAIGKYHKLAKQFK